MHPSQQMWAKARVGLPSSPRQIARDPIKILSQRSPRKIEPRPRDQPEKTLLRDVLRGVHCACHAVREPKYRCLMLIENTAKCTPISGASPPHQGPFFLVRHASLYAIRRQGGKDTVKIASGRFFSRMAGFPRGIMERLKGALAFALDLERAPE